MKNIAFNMETGDPDDALTLCLLATHPKVNLVAVVINPGTDEQVGLVKLILSRLSEQNPNLQKVPVGSRKPGHDKQCVSPFHQNWLGKIEKIAPDDYGYNVLAGVKTAYDDLIIVSGAPLGNVYDFLVKTQFYLNELVVQGGFAGDNIMPPELILEKFAGKITCATYNLGGDKEAALYITANRANIGVQHYISKNVCHGVCYNQELHDKLLPIVDEKKNLGLAFVYRAMSIYLKNKPQGKLFHDPLAAAVAIDNSVCDFVRVSLYREKGEWGSRLDEDSNCYISVKYNKEKFENVLFGI